MNMTHKTTAWIAVAALVIVAACVGTGCNHDKPAAGQEKITLQLHWIPDPHQAGFWVALDKGFYTEAGIDATVLPGGMDSNPIKAAVSGNADLAQVGGVEQAVTAVSEGLPLKAIAAIQRETPHALISLERKPIRTAADLRGKTIAVAYGDTAEILLKSFMEEQGVKESEVKMVPFKFDLSILLNGQVDAVTGFRTSQNATLEKMGQKPVVLDYSTGNISSYGYTIVASEQSLAKKGEAIKRFIEASRKGWQYTFDHPDEAMQIMKKRFGESFDVDLSKRQLSLLKPLMVDSQGKLETWDLDSKRVEGVIGFLTRRKQLKGSVNAGAVIDNTYSK